MSPEQAQGRVLDGRSDLYAVGVMLFQMLTGAVPFGEDDAVVVMAHHIKTPAPRVLEVHPSADIPQALDDLVAASLQKRPVDRPESAEEFLRAIEALPIEGARAGITNGPFAGTSRTPRVTATRTASVFAIVIAVGIALFTALPSHRRTALPVTPTATLPVVALPVAVAPTAMPTPEETAAPPPVVPPDPFVETAPAPASGTPRRRHHSRHRARPIVPSVSVTSTPAPAPHAPYPRWSD